MMRHGSLFSGIGGFDLAALWMGWRNVFQVEIDRYCTGVLAKNFPDVARYGDVRGFDGRGYRGEVDVLTAGFPCQPFSLAGKRKGAEDDRYLWNETFRVVREVAPGYFVGENVPGIIGLAFDKVCADLEGAGYEVQTFIIPACAVGAWHRRDRVWFVGVSEDRRRGKEGDGYRAFEDAVVADADGSGCEEQWVGESEEAEFSSVERACGWAAEPGVGRVVDGFPGRVDRLKGLGNAIVPQVALEVFKIIERYEQFPASVED